MSSPKASTHKKVILSTTEVSQMLLSKGRHKINESILSHNAKTNNNIEITDIASQMNIKLSKEGENVTGVTGLGDQSMFKGLLEKSTLFKPMKGLDKSIFSNNYEKYSQKDNILSKLGNSQMGNNPMEPIQEVKPRKKLLRIDTNELLSDKAQTKFSYIINNYFPYENDISPDADVSSKLKNFVVIFYFIIEKNTFLLIRKFNKKYLPIYFWNREEDAKKYGVKYSQITTPGLNFKTFENFTNAFKNKIVNQEQLVKLRNKINEKNILYEQNIENLKKEYKNNEDNIKIEYEIKIREIKDNNIKLNDKIMELENVIKLNYYHFVY